jgi:putative ABC transport system substrate-binding protein
MLLFPSDVCRPVECRASAEKVADAARVGPDGENRWAARQLNQSQRRDPIESQVAAQDLGLQLNVLHANSESDFDKAFAAMAQLRVGALVIGTDGFLNSRSEQLAALAMRHGMPAIFQYREFTAAGGLMSYGTSLTDTYRQVGVYVGRILKGEKPADLPVQQVTKIELYINLKTAKALGITVPLPLSGRADELFE